MNRVYVSDQVILRVGHVNGRGESQLELTSRLSEREVAAPAVARDESLADGDLIVTAWWLPSVQEGDRTTD
jgi:hypothetical protein